MTSIATSRPTPADDDVNAATAAGLIESAIDRLQRASNAAMRIDTITGATAVNAAIDALRDANNALEALRPHERTDAFRATRLAERRWVVRFESNDRLAHRGLQTYAVAFEIASDFDDVVIVVADPCEWHDDQPEDGCPTCADIEADRGDQIDREIDERRLR